MARQFTDILRDIAGGQCADELTAKLAEVVEAVSDTRKVGSLSFSLKIRPNGDNSVTISEQIKAIVPEKARGDSVFFTTAGGDLLRTDPRQVDMFPKEVKAADGPLREVANG